MPSLILGYILWHCSSEKHLLKRDRQHIDLGLDHKEAQHSVQGLRV
jgi:hypothetical protein